MFPLDDLRNLGGARDVFPIPPPPLIAWAEGDRPHGEEIDLNEYPVELLKVSKCRSFRADLRHKLTIIIRANGGYGRNGLVRAAEELKVSRQTLFRWLRWDSTPGHRLILERIDNRYVDSLEKLVAEKVRKKQLDKKRGRPLRRRH